FLTSGPPCLLTSGPPSGSFWYTASRPLYRRTVPPRLFLFCGFADLVLFVFIQLIDRAAVNVSIGHFHIADATKSGEIVADSGRGALLKNGLFNVVLREIEGENSAVMLVGDLENHESVLD